MKKSIQLKKIAKPNDIVALDTGISSFNGMTNVGTSKISPAQLSTHMIFRRK